MDYSVYYDYDDEEDKTDDLITKATQQSDPDEISKQELEGKYFSRAATVYLCFVVCLAEFQYYLIFCLKLGWSVRPERLALSVNLDIFELFKVCMTIPITVRCDLGSISTLKSFTRKSVRPFKKFLFLTFFS